MNPFDCRDITWPVGCESPSVSTSLFPTYGARRNYSYPSALPSVYPGRSNRVDVTRSVNTSRKSSPAANEVSHAEYKSPYDQARHYVERFNLWNNQKTSTLATPDEINLYEKPFSLKMSFDDWIKLRDDLQIFETDQKLEYSSEI
jgi:hypothetical protein